MYIVAAPNLYGKLVELEHDFRYLILTTLTVIQSQLLEDLVIKKWLFFIDLRKTALSLHWLLILYPFVTIYNTRTPF